MKKIAALFLCLLFLFNIMGYNVAFLIKRSQLKKEMKAFINSDACAKNLQKLFIPIDEYEISVNFIEKNEFIFKGEMYDLVKKETSSTGIILNCVNDQKEKHLLEVAKEHFSRNHDQNNATNKSSSVIKNIIKEACPEQITRLCVQYFSDFIFEEFSSKLYSTFLSTFSPPPKFIA